MWPAYEQWATSHRPWEDGDYERPAKLKDATLLQLVKPSGQVHNRLWLPTGHIMPVPIAGGARLFDDAALDRLIVDSTPITAYPITMAYRGKSNDATLDQAGFWIGDKDATADFLRLSFDGAAAGDPIKYSLRAAGAALSTSTGFTADVWHHALCYSSSSTAHAVFIDGGSKATSITSNTFSASADRVAVGHAADSTPTNYFSGDIAEAAIWDVALSDAEVALLGAASGPSAMLFRPASLRFYCPIIGKYSPEIDIIEGRGMTVTGAVASAHPRVFYPDSPMISMPPAAAPPAGVVGPLIGGRLINNSMLVGGRLVGR